MFTLYSFLLTVAFILLSPVFLLRREKYAAGFWQRLGYLPEFRRDNRPVLWLHCVSVGEANAARPLVDELKNQFPEYRLIVSTTTKTGQNHAAEIFKEKADAIFYFPFDWRFAVRRALRNYKPRAVLLMETELWFNFIREASKNGVFVAVVNGRLSEKSFRNYSFVRSLMRRVLARVDLALMQTTDDAGRLMLLGARAGKVKVTGSVKFDQQTETRETVLTENLRRRFGFSENEPLIVAASTHAPEERVILRAFEEIKRNSAKNQPRLLIAPRRPERFDQVAELLEESGYKWARRSGKESKDDRAAAVILLDSIGELRAVYALAEIVFVGGSLVPHGGQSVLEPAAHGKAIVTGFYTANFAAIVREFSGEEALVQLPECDEKEAVELLTEIFVNLLGDREKRVRLGARALAVTEKNRGASARTVEFLKPFLRTRK